MVASIIVLSKDRPDFLHRLASSIHLSNVDSEVILVDNGSDDETPELAKANGWRYLTKGTNLSFSEGCNWAAKEAYSDWLFLVNNDAILGPDILSTLLSHHQTDPVTGVLIKDSTGMVNHAGVAFSPVGDTPAPLHIGRGDEFDEWAGKDCMSWPAVTFATVLIHREMWNELGGLDANYVYGFEDTDFCLRMVEQKQILPKVCYQTYSTHDEFGTRVVGDDEPNLFRFMVSWMYNGRAWAAIQAALDL
jgi:GT2 family glycosyltransferase